MIRSSVDWPALGATLLLVIVCRELSVWLMGWVGYAALGNLVGLFALLAILLIYRRFHTISARLIDANTRIMKESALAFLPIAAGAGVMMASLGGELGWFILVMTVSTLLPLWGYAWLSKRWLAERTPTDIR
ncbi:MAG: hypothetical protein VXW65_09950 [Pseudomonadota bacterium]|nr:hypothetical protein [Pseudomonadota bacterium]